MSWSLALWKTGIIITTYLSAHVMIPCIMNIESQGRGPLHNHALINSGLPMCMNQESGNHSFMIHDQNIKKKNVRVKQKPCRTKTVRSWLAVFLETETETDTPRKRISSCPWSTWTDSTMRIALRLLPSATVITRWSSACGSIKNLVIIICWICVPVMILYAALSFYVLVVRG